MNISYPKQKLSYERPGSICRNIVKIHPVDKCYKDVNWIKLAEDKDHGIFYGNDYSTPM